MSVLDRLRGGTVAALTEDDDSDVDGLRADLALSQDQLELAQESLLELALEDVGWRRLSAGAELQFTRDGLRRMAGLCRIMATANPLIKRGLNLRHYYVWGQGLSISARSTGPDRKNQQAQDVNAVVQAFLDDESNRSALAGEQAREENERALGTDGNVFFALFTSPLTGRVQVRVLPFDDMCDVISNPDDSADVWYYRRRWSATVVDPQSLVVSRQQQEALYPALGYSPTTKPTALGGVPVHWDAPVLHLRVNGQRGWAYGIPDAYAAIDWARAFKEFLEDWAKLVKALSRFAWKATAPGSRARRRAVANAINTPPSRDRFGEPNDVGAAAVSSPDVTLEAIPKSGATIDSNSGRPLASMVAAALDVPVTMLLADPGVTGARATAQTLDRPTELMAATRRALWSDALRRILRYVVDEAVRAPRGPLKGTVSRDRLTGDEVVTLAGDTDATMDISWPDLDEVNLETSMKALQIADQMEKTPPLVIARLVLELLGVEDVDEVLDDMTDDDGNFVPPDVTAGQVAVDAFRNGGDPAAAVGGEPPVPPDQGAGQA